MSAFIKLCLVSVCLPVCLFVDVLVYVVVGPMHGAAVALDWAWGYTGTRPSYFWSVPPMTVKWARRLAHIWKFRRVHGSGDPCRA